MSQPKLFESCLSDLSVRRLIVQKPDRLATLCKTYVVTNGWRHAFYAVLLLPLILQYLTAARGSG